MLKRYSVRNLDQSAIEMLTDLGAILEDCIYAYWSEVFSPGDVEPESWDEAA